MLLTLILNVVMRWSAATNSRGRSIERDMEENRGARNDGYSVELRPDHEAHSRYTTRVFMYRPFYHVHH